MWLSGVLLLICHYQMVSASKTIMTNEISMPSLGHKEKTATFHRLQAKEILPIRYRSARFERLRAAPEDMKPVFVKPAFIETEQSNLPSSQSTPIEVVPSAETVTEIPLESLPTSNETPAETAPRVPSELPTEPAFAFQEVPVETAFMSSEAPIVETSSAFQETTPAFQETVQTFVETSEGPFSESPNFPQERVYPTAISVAPTIEFIEVPPSSQVEVASTNVIEVEETVPTSTKAPRKRRHRRKHRKLRKITKQTEMPTEIPTNTPIETPTKVTTAFELPSEPSTEPSITTTPITTAAPSTTETPTSPPTIQTFSTFGSTGARIGESYLGGWNEDEGVIVTTSGPSLGSAMNQFSEIPESIPINDDQAIKAYYEKYYAEWYQKHNQASSTSEVVTSAAPREIKIGLAKKLHGIESTTQSFGISSSTAKPTKEQLDKVCDYVAKISKSFGIKDLVGFAKNNCPFVQSFHPASSCEQIQHLMQYCVTGILANN